MQSERTSLDDLPGKLVDVDADRKGDWVAAANDNSATWVVSCTGRFRAARHCKRPAVRLLSDGRVLLVERREKPRGAPNAWLHERGGDLVSAWCVGDYVADVVCVDGVVAVTYIDQAYGDERGFDGVSLFTTAGTALAHYNRFGRNTVVDCYCATRVGPNRLAFLVYPGFSLVELHVKELTEKSWEAPAAVCGAAGLTSWRGDYLFHGSYSDRTSLVAWTPGESEGISVGSFERALRGLGNGRFLAIDDGGYTIVSFS